MDFGYLRSLLFVGLSWSKRRLTVSSWRGAARIWRRRTGGCKKKFRSWEHWNFPHSSTCKWPHPPPSPCAPRVSVLRSHPTPRHHPPPSIPGPITTRWFPSTIPGPSLSRPRGPPPLPSRNNNNGPSTPSAAPGRDHPTSGRGHFGHFEGRKKRKRKKRWETLYLERKSRSGSWCYVTILECVRSMCKKEAVVIAYQFLYIFSPSKFRSL